MSTELYEWHFSFIGTPFDDVFPASKETFVGTREGVIRYAIEWFKERLESRLPAGRLYSLVRAERIPEQ